MGDIAVAQDLLSNYLRRLAFAMVIYIGFFPISLPFRNDVVDGCPVSLFEFLGKAPAIQSILPFELPVTVRGYKS